MEFHDHYQHILIITSDTLHGHMMVFNEQMMNGLYAHNLIMMVSNT